MGHVICSVKTGPNQSIVKWGNIKLQRRSTLNLLGEAGTDFQISK
jgi:hypothetical protein